MSQAEKVFLTQKGAVLEVLLEVASEIAVHKKQHTGTKFPELRDAQLLEFLEKFLEEYGGYSAERPTERNYFRLERCGSVGVGVGQQPGGQRDTKHRLLS